MHPAVILYLLYPLRTNLFRSLSVCMTCSVLKRLGLPALIWPAFSNSSLVVQEYYSQKLDAVPNPIQGYRAKPWADWYNPRSPEGFQPREELPTGLQHPNTYAGHATQGVLDKVASFRPPQVPFLLALSQTFLSVLERTVGAGLQEPEVLQLLARSCAYT